MYKIAPIYGLLLLMACSQEKSHTTWSVYRGNAASNAYSALDQVNTGNVHRLQVAWTYSTGDSGYSIECNPIVVNGVLYATSPALKVIALDAATGKLIWQFDPSTHIKPDGVNRGVTYWEDDDDKRIFFSASYYLYVLNAQTGELITSFGDSGRVDMRQGLDRNVNLIALENTSPGIIYKDLLICGSRVSEGEGAAPGHVRAFDVRSGKQAWIFHTIPKPGEPNYETWEEGASQNAGGANAWSGLSLDEKRGLVFFATGSCAPDFYGGDRKGANLYANSVVCLNAATGKYVWHYQLVHHDTWDYDLPAPPNLVTVTHNGKRVDAVAQVTKTGHVFLFERENGRPLFDIEERKVPASDIEGEETWPTQPFPVKPPAFVRQRYTEADISDISPEATAYIRERLKNVRNEGMYTPASENGSLVFPGFRGGGEWNGGSFDVETGILYVNANEIPNISGLKKVPVVETGKALYELNCATCHGIDRTGGGPSFPSLIDVAKRMTQSDIMQQIKNGKGQMPAFPIFNDDQLKAITEFLLDPRKDHPVANSKPVDPAQVKYSYAHSGYGQFLDPEGYPAVKPPWGTLTAIDLNKGELLWQVPVGEYEELTRRGIPPTGTQNFGGSIVTSGGLVFVGASKDEKFRAFDKKTGKILWETKLPFGGYATPCTYMAGGKQYIVIAAGGGGKNDTKRGDKYIAFALP